MLDLDGLQVAYLGVALAHYLDLETGDILDVPLDADAPGDESRFRRIPTRTDESEAADRAAFLVTAASAPLRDALSSAVDDGSRFRQILTADRRVERSFFNFKNDQATRAIEVWLLEQGLAADETE